MDLVADYRRRREHQRLIALEQRVTRLEFAMHGVYVALDQYGLALSMLRKMVNGEVKFIEPEPSEAIH